MPHSPADSLLIASGSGPGPSGWLLAIHAGKPVEIIDRIHSFGLTMVDDHLYRVLCSAPEAGTSGELLVYDEKGIASYRRIDGLADPHGAVWDGQSLVVPCSATNEILWLSPDGKINRKWRAPGEDDSWHLNGACWHDGRLFVSAFGRFPTNRELITKMRTPVGIVFDLESGTDEVTGLCCPHDPAFADSSWIVCNSSEYELVAVEPASNRRLRSVALGGWTRGLAFTNDFIYVGVSSERHKGDAGFGSIVTLDRKTWEILERVELPCQEVQSLCVVPSGMASGLRRGFRTNSYRISVQNREDMFHATGSMQPEFKVTEMPALDAIDRSIAARMSLPTEVTAGQPFPVWVEFTNLGRHPLLTAIPHPVNMACKLASAGDPASYVETRRENLPKPVPALGSFRWRLEVPAPATLSEYELVFTLVQEWVAWFDDVNTGSVRGRFRVIEGTPLKRKFRSYRSRSYNRRILAAWFAKVFAAILSHPFSPISTKSSG